MKNKVMIIKIVEYLVISLVLIVILLLIISSNKKITCTNKSDQSKNGYVLETKYVIKPKGKDVSKVFITETITSEEKDKLKYFEKQFKDQYSYNNKIYGGYTYKVTNKDNKVTVNLTIDYNKFDMKKFSKDNVAMKKYTKGNKLTVEGAKKMYKASGATCK